MESVDFSTNVICELNNARTNPQFFADKLRKYATYFKGNVLKLPSGENIMTKEGADAYEDAAKFLDNFTAVGALAYNEALTNSAKEYIEAVEKVEIEKMNDLTIDTFIEKHGRINGHLGQSVDFGSALPEQVIINLIVDDGDSERANRSSILDKQFKQIGVSKGTHKTFHHCTALFYAQDFVAKKTDNKKEEIKEINDKVKELHLNKEESASEVVDNSKCGVEGNFDIPEGYEKIERQERIVTENGVKKKIVKLTKYKEDGSTDIEMFKEKI